MKNKTQTKLNKMGVNKMEKVKETITRVVFKNKCEECYKELVGTSENQVIYNMKVHKMTQHPSEITK